MANTWLRLWHDMPTDPKWRVIARASGQPVHLVMALYVTLLVDASKNMSRGVTECHDEDLAVTLDCDIGQIEAIKLAMQGRVLDGNYLSGWDRRQPKREDSGNPESGSKSAAERKRAQREREKELLAAEDKKEGHAKSQNVTTDKDKDKDKDIKTPTSQSITAGEADKFAMDIGWIPSAHVETQAKQSGNPLLPGDLPEFIAHWLTQPLTKRTQAEWDKSLLQSAKHRQLRAASPIPTRGKPAPENFAEKNYGTGITAL